MLCRKEWKSARYRFAMINSMLAAVRSALNRCMVGTTPAKIRDSPAVLGINFELPGKIHFFAHYSFLSHVEMHGEEEIVVHYTFGAVRVTGHRLEAIYSLLKKHHLEFVCPSEAIDPCRAEIEVIKILFESAREVNEI